MPPSILHPLKLRPVEPGDELVLLKIYASTREEEMALVPWSDDERRTFLEGQFNAQQSHYSQKYPLAEHDMIMRDGVAVGRLYVARLNDEIRIVDITLMPEYRGSGVGSQLLAQLIKEADATGKPLRIYVESFNRSLGLFERLGFARTAEHGIHLLMEKLPGAGPQPDDQFVQ